MIQPARQPQPSPLSLYGRPADVDALPWDWVEQRLAAADGYWVVSAGTEQPHPRPVWGIWEQGWLLLSVGSPTIAAALEPGSGATVHLASVTEVVIVEGRVLGPSDDPQAIARYNEKYSWDYTTEAYGPLTVIEPTKVMAWRSAGWAGQGGFQAAGRWLRT